MTPEARLIARAAKGEDIRADAAALLARKKAAKSARSRRPARSVAGTSRSESKRTEEEKGAAFYDQAKRGAAVRAGALFNADGEIVLPPRCEYVIGAPGFEKCCPAEGVDPDHVIGGAHRKECERLGAEGLEILCRGHHDLKHANAPTREAWLDHAEDHASRHGFVRLLSLIAKARAKYEGRHPEARSSASEATK